MSANNLIRDARRSSAPLLLPRAPSTTSRSPMLHVAAVNNDAVGAGRHLPTPGSDADITEPTMSLSELERTFEAQLTQLRIEAREEGIREGREVGHAEVRKAQSVQLEAMAEFVRAARERLERDIDGLADVAIEVVFEAVAKILGQSCADSQGTAAIVRELVRGAKDRSRLVARVHKSDLAWICAHEDSILEASDAGSVEFVADDRVVLGGCILETPVGSIDGRLETQFASLRDVLLTARAEREADE